MPHGGTESPGTARSCSKSDLDELSRQMKENIVQLKSLLGIRNKDYQIPWTERDALSLPATRNGSLIYEGRGSLLIPSKQSAFTQFSTWSLPANETLQMELDSNGHSFSARSMDKLPDYRSLARDRYSAAPIRSPTKETRRDVSSSTEDELPKRSRHVRKSDREQATKSKRGARRIDAEKVEQVQRQALLLQRRCDLLERENEKIKKAKKEKTAKIADLKHRNGELVSVAKKLEERAKDLHLENCRRNSKADAMEGDNLEQKKNFASIMAQVQTDHEKETKERDKEIKILKNQIQDLKKALSEAKSLQLSVNGGPSLEAALKQSQKESLRLQKLAASGSKKVTIRSLSMPVTARQKILEDTNRALRRQLAEYEEAGHALAGRTVQDLKSELEIVQKKCADLEKANNESCLQTVNLESQLQIAKVEASDTNIKMNELKSSFEQLRHDYDQVHEQLAVAIKERDTAIEQFKEKAHEIATMLRERKKSEKVVEYELEDGGRDVEVHDDSLTDSKPEVLDITDLRQDEPAEKKPAPATDANEQSIRVEDVKNESSEAEEVSEEIIKPEMDESTEKVKLFIAKYTYDPFDGPNEFPEVELKFYAGDYVYVYGSMDEDGFYEGELENGERGLVPSNFLVAAVDDSRDADLDILGDTKRSDALHGETLLSGSEERFSDQEGVSMSHSALLRGVAPYPQDLQITKKLSHSLIIGWSRPVMNEDKSVFEYQIFVNGKFRMSVDGKKSNAVVEDIDHAKTTRLEVCAVTSLGISDGNLCVISHGEGSSQAPTGVAMEMVGSTSARVAWKPSTGQRGHIVTVMEEGSSIFPVQDTITTTHPVPSPAYRLTIDKLRPNYKYTVSVSLEGYGEDSSTCFTSFITPEAGPPEPPIGVQIEECSNKSYILVTWLPVTLNTLGTSNGVVVSGYSIHIAGVKIHEVHSPTLDQCTIRAQCLADAIKQQSRSKSLKFTDEPSETLTSDYAHLTMPVCIKSHAVNGQESDLSEPCVLPQRIYQNLLKLCQNDGSYNQNMSPTIKTRPPGTSLESTDLSASSDTSMPAFHANFDTPKKSTRHKSDAFKQSRVVPSIEITQGSDEDENVHDVEKNRVGTNSDDLDGNFTSSFETNYQKLDDLLDRTEDRNVSKNVSGVFSDFSGGDDNNMFANAKNDQRVAEVGKRTAEYQRHHRYHDDTRGFTKRPLSVASDEQSVGSHKSHSSSHRGRFVKPRSKEPGRFLRQSTLSSQSGSEMPSEVEPTHPGHVNRGKVRLFVAIYPYDPKVSSPNAESYQEELSFAQGQVIKVFGDKDDDGFFFGETNDGVRGYAPCNLIKEVDVSGVADVNALYKRKNLPSASPDIEEQSSAESKTASKTLENDEEAANRVGNSPRKRRFEAQYDYDASECSPNPDADKELSFKRGDIITVYGSIDSDGFYQGKLDGKVGLVPSNFLKEITRRKDSLRSNPHDKSSEFTKPRQANRISNDSSHSSVTPRTSKHVDQDEFEWGSQSSGIDSANSKKKGGLISKGKKLFRKLGGSQDGKRR